VVQVTEMYQERALKLTHNFWSRILGRQLDSMELESVVFFHSRERWRGRRCRLIEELVGQVWSRQHRRAVGQRLQE
jgi:hypothetical protein